MAVAKSSFLTKTIITVVSIVVIFVFLRIFNVWKPIKSLTSQTLSPVFSVFYGGGQKVSSVFKTPSDLKDLETENERLRGENTDLKMMLASLQVQEQDNKSYKELLDFFDNQGKDYPRAVAKVIGRDPDVPTILMLNVGERDGVKVNNAVVIQDGLMVAKIIEVSNKTSKALLLSDTQSSVAVMVLGGTPSSKIAKGDRGLSISLDQVPQQEIIRDGQIIVTSGLESSIPEGFVIGEVEEIVSEKNDLFQSAVLKPLVDYNTLRIVAVILSS